MVYHLLRSLLKMFSYIPFGVMYFLSDILFFLMYYAVGYRRKIVRQNLTDSFPEKDLKEIKRIERNFYRFFSDMIVESCKLASISKEEMMSRMKFTNIEAVNALQREGKSVAIYLGHYGNWEWISSLLLWLEKDITGAQIYHRLSNPAMDRLIMELRERFGVKCVEMRQTARYVHRQMTEHRICTIGFIADQSPRKKDARHFLTFLNHRTPVLVGTEKITKHYGFTAWFLDVRRIKRGYYEAEFVRLHEDPQSLPDFELTSLYFGHLERVIRERPELYLWSHNRFKYTEDSVAQRRADQGI